MSASMINIRLLTLSTIIFFMDLGEDNSGSYNWSCLCSVPTVQDLSSKGLILQ